MKIYEYQAKKLFSTYGIPVERHILCYTLEDVRQAYIQLDTEAVVIKAQVLTGGRGKAGGIKLVKNETELLTQASSILQMKIKNIPVNKVLISEAVQIVSEYYLSFTIDRNNKSVVLIFSSEGGMDIEEVAHNTPERIQRFCIDPTIGIPLFLANRVAFLLFNNIEQVRQGADIIQKLYTLFIESDASLTEINPLVLTHEGRLLAIDAKITFDDNALFRHPAIQLLHEPTEEEKKEVYAKSQGFNYIHLGGEVGCMVNGAGLAMATLDMIKLYGGNPANFLDIGGSSNPRKVVEAMKLLLSDGRVKVILINIFGGITRCDDIASGLLQAFEQLQTSLPVVIRLAGTNEKEARNLLRNSSFYITETMNEATQMAVRLSL